MYESSYTLTAPAYVTIRTHCGSKEARLDVYKARRVLDDAERKPSEELRWAAILSYLSTALNVPQDELAESSALEFHEVIVTIVSKLNEERKKKAASIACSLTSTPASPPATATGP
jgi:hypothetical protein